MKHSDSIKNITEALTNMHVSYKKDSKNPHFGNKYASISAILQAIGEPLAENGLTVIQSPRPHDGNIVVETRILHTSGEWIETETFIPVQGNDPQKACSAITYGRRYGLESAFGIAAEDDDGNGASDKPPKQPAKPVPINFDRIREDLSSMKTEEEINGYMIKIKGRPDRKDWSVDQVKDVKKILDDNIARVKIETTLGEQQ